MSLNEKAKVLSDAEQKKTIGKGKANQFQKKKCISKPVLECPFILEWPEFQQQDIQELIKLLQESCTGLKKITFKPNWYEIKNLKGKERKDFIDNYSKTKLDEAKSEDPSLGDKLIKLDEVWSEIVLGYNAVMRGISNNTIAAIIVNQSASPEYLVKTFLPACANNCIPLIPIKNLDSILKDEKMLGCSYSCMAMGLNNKVKASTSNFNALYNKMCSVLEINVEGIETKSDDDEGKVEDNEESSVCNDEEIKENALNSVDKAITNLEFTYLKRKSKSSRVFIPGVSDTNSPKETCKFDSSMNFISIASNEKSKTTDSESRTQIKKKKNKKAKPLSNLSNVDFDSMFVLDNEGNDDDNVESSGNTDLKNEIEDKVKASNKRKKEESARYYEYKPAVVKKIKSNPKREKK